MHGMSTRGVTERSETGPSHQTQTAITIDAHYTFRNDCVLLVELKRPWVIREARWAGGPANSDTTKGNLEREVRM